jgi:hypothetical protein
MNFYQLCAKRSFKNGDKLKSPYGSILTYNYGSWVIGETQTATPLYAATDGWEPVEEKKEEVYTLTGGEALHAIVDGNTVEARIAGAVCRFKIFHGDVCVSTNNCSWNATDVSWFLKDNILFRIYTWSDFVNKE